MHEFDATRCRGNTERAHDRKECQCISAFRRVDGFSNKSCTKTKLARDTDTDDEAHQDIGRGVVHESVGDHPNRIEKDRPQQRFLASDPVT